MQKQKKMWVPTINIHGRSQNLCHLDSGVGLKLGSSGFSPNQSNRSSSSAYATCIYCGLSVKINMRKMPHSAKIVGAFVLRLFLCVWLAKFWAPWLTTPLHRAVLGSTVYVYGSNPFSISAAQINFHEINFKCAIFLFSSYRLLVPLMFTRKWQWIYSIVPLPSPVQS